MLFQSAPSAIRILKRFQLFPPDLVVEEDAPLRFARGGVPNLDRYNAVSFLDRQRNTEEVAVNDAESAGGNRYGYRDAASSNQR